jgi:uncharacterized BrkB/YihY/UPF0761 family membrane protein
VAEEESDNASNDDAEDKKDKKKDDDKKQRPPAPHWSSKALRVFLFATLGTFLAAYIFGNSIPSGLRVDFDLIASIKLGLISGVISAVLRALVAMLPVFPDD